MSTSYDAIVIGAGQAGPPLAVRLAKAGLKTALVERERSAFGQTVTVSGLHEVMVSTAGTYVMVPDQPPLPTNVGPGGRHPSYTAYRCADDEWLFLAALTPKFQVNAFKVLGVDVFADERIQGVTARMLLPENRGWIRQLLGVDPLKGMPRLELHAALKARRWAARPRI